VLSVGRAGVFTGIRAIVFDVNGTLVDIRTDEGMEQIYRAIGRILTYQGIDLRRGEVRELYHSVVREQQSASPEEHPEFDAVAAWRTIVERHASAYTRALPAEKLAQLPLFLAETFRGISRRKLVLYPHVREVLDVLRARFPLAVVTDAQRAYARPELARVGLLEYFDPIVVSGEHGFRKPDKRLFEMALVGVGVDPEHAVYVGNDMHRDVHGAREAGMRTVLFDSDHGTKVFGDCVPDVTITDHRELLTRLA
jgi:putative hydrolase of the HAD superfamily